MSTSFRNFLITFGVCLLLFGLIGWKLIYPALNGVIDDDTTSTDSNVSTISGPTDTPDDTSDVIVEGDIFTAVVVGKSPDGHVTSIIYFRVNEATKHFSYSLVPTDLKMPNNVGVDVPFEVLLSTVNGEEIIKKVSAATGMHIDYYTILGTDELTAIVNKFEDAKINIDSDIKFINPEREKDLKDFDTSEDIPEDFYISIPKGNNTLNADLVKNIMMYDSISDNYTLTKQLYEIVFMEFFTNSQTNNESATKSLLNDIKATNITSSVVDTYSDFVFPYFEYKEEVSFASKASSSSTYDIEKAIKDFRKADGIS